MLPRSELHSMTNFPYHKGLYQVLNLVLTATIVNWLFSSVSCRNSSQSVCMYSFFSVWKTPNCSNFREQHENDESKTFFLLNFLFLLVVSVGSLSEAAARRVLIASDLFYIELANAFDRLCELSRCINMIFITSIIPYLTADRVDTILRLENCVKIEVSIFFLLFTCNTFSRFSAAMLARALPDNRAKKKQVRRHRRCESENLNN